MIPWTSHHLMCFVSLYFIFKLSVIPFSSWYCNAWSEQRLNGKDAFFLELVAWVPAGRIKEVMIKGLPLKPWAMCSVFFCIRVSLSTKPGMKKMLCQTPAQQPSGRLTHFPGKLHGSKFLFCNYSVGYSCEKKKAPFYSCQMIAPTDANTFFCVTPISLLM